MTGKNDTSSYARIFFSLASDSMMKNIFITCAKPCDVAPSFKFVRSVIPIQKKSVKRNQAPAVKEIGSSST